MNIHPHPNPFPPKFYLTTGPALLLAHWYFSKKKSAPQNIDAIARLEHLYRLMKLGAITEEEFNVMKEKLKEQL